MKLKVKRKLLGNILSDGSFCFAYGDEVSPEVFKSITSLDVVNHFVWTGKGPKEQTEIASFVLRFNK